LRPLSAAQRVAHSVPTRTRRCLNVHLARRIAQLAPTWRLSPSQLARDRRHRARTGHFRAGASVALTAAMTRSFHAPVRLVPRRPRRAPRPETLSFTCFRLVPIDEGAAEDAPYAPIELCDPTNAMRVLRLAPQRFAARPKRVR